MRVAVALLLLLVSGCRLSAGPMQSAPSARGTLGYVVISAPDAVEDGELILVDGDARARIGYIRGRWPRYSPDGRSLLFEAAAGDRSAICVADAEGSGARRLTDPAADCFSPSWSPDGRRIVFASRRGKNSDVFVMDADGQHVVQITSEPGIDSGPAWSPDGQRIAFHSDRSGHAEVHLMNADGRNVTPLTPGRSAAAPSWSPDGKEIAFAYGFDGGGGRISVMRADRSRPRPLTKGSEFVSLPAWSPDGAQLAFTAQRSESEPWVVYVIDRDGRHRTQVASNAVDPFWKPVR